MSLLKPVRSLSLFSRLVLFANLLAAMVLLLSYSASWFSPQHFWPMAFLGLLFPALAIVNMAFIPYWALVKRPLLLLPLMVLLPGLELMTRYVRWNTSTDPAASETHLKVVSYNVSAYERRQWSDEQHEPYTHQFLSFFHKEQPDILCIQEHLAYDDTERKIRQMIQDTAGTPHYFLKKYYNTYRRSQAIGIFTRYPIVNHGFEQSYYQGRERTFFVYADMDVHEDTIRVYSIHLQSNSLNEEEFLFTTTPNLGDKEYQSRARIKAMSLTRKLKYAFQRRAKQIDILEAHIRNSPYPVIVAGDLNDTPASYTFARLNSILTDSYKRRSGGKIYTYQGNFPSFRIDYIFHDHHFQAANTQIIKQKYSDHYPLRTYLKISD